MYMCIRFVILQNTVSVWQCAAVCCRGYIFSKVSVLQCVAVFSNQQSHVRFTGAI